MCAKSAKSRSSACPSGSAEADAGAATGCPGATESRPRDPSISQIPLSPADAWGVVEGGRVVGARVAGCQLEWIGPDGSTTRGPPVEYERIAIGTPEKEA